MQKLKCTYISRRRVLRVIETEIPIIRITYEIYYFWIFIFSVKYTRLSICYLSPVSYWKRSKFLSYSSLKSLKYEFTVFTERNFLKTLLAFLVSILLKQRLDYTYIWFVCNIERVTCEFRFDNIYLNNDWSKKKGRFEYSYYSLYVNSKFSKKTLLYNYYFFSNNILKRIWNSVSNTYLKGVA